MNRKENNSIDCSRKFSVALPDVDIIDIGHETGLQRMIKSDEEIAVTRISAAAADIGGGPAELLSRRV